jgi:hypothetical protein
MPHRTQGDLLPHSGSTAPGWTAYLKTSRVRVSGAGAERLRQSAERRACIPNQKLGDQRDVSCRPGTRARGPQAAVQELPSRAVPISEWKVGISSIGLVAVRHAGPLYEKPVFLPLGAVSECARHPFRSAPRTERRSASPKGNPWYNSLNKDAGLVPQRPSEGLI